MRLYRLLLAAVLLGFAALPGVYAQTASSPYTVVVPVPDTTPTQRNDAFATALGQVLTRVAGGQDLRSNPDYADALNGASALVQKYQYQRAGAGLALQVDFESGAVRRLVTQLGIPSAGVKPPVLLLVQGTDGVLFDQAALTELAAAAAARDTGVVYPDGGDSVDLAKVAVGDPDTLAALNQRYHTGLILVGRLHAGSADWTLVSGGQVQHWSAKGGTEDALLGDAGASVAARVGQQLNVVGASLSDGTLWVDGLHSAQDYADLLAALRGDPAVREVNTLGAQDDGVLLNVKAALPLTGLVANLAASGRVLRQSAAHTGADVTLRWVH